MTSLAFVCTALTGAGVSLIHAADQDLEKLNRFVQSSNSSSAAMTAFREGRDLVNKEEWAKAADKFNQIVTKYPNSEVTDAALYWLAFSLKKQNKFQETDDTLGRLIKGFPRSNWIKDAKAMKDEIALHLGRGESVTEEIHREYKLSPGARVEVSNINGPVEIETADTDMAEVHITRFAQGPADINGRKLQIVDKPDGLTIHAEGNNLGVGVNEVRHRVALKIPRRVDLTIKHASDRLKVGEIDGSINLNGLSWKAEMSLAAGQIELSRVSGTAVIRVTKLDKQGVKISNVSGKVELLAPADLNADIDVNGNHGKVILGLQHKMHEGTLNGIRFRAQIGSGGAPISISNIIGTVSLRQL